MVIRFKRKSQSEALVLFALVMPFAFFLLMDFLRMPSLIKYTIDIAWLWLLINLIRNRTRIRDAQVKKFAVFVGLFCLWTVFGQLSNYQSAIYYLWGLRNNFRFYVFFLGCVYFLRVASVENYLKFFDVVLYINIPVILYQYFILGKTGDYLGGIFGIDHGCNGYMNLFLLIVVTSTILRYMSYTEKMGACFLKCLIAILFAILAEMKFFLLEFAGVVILASLMTKFSIRKVWIILGAIVGVFVAAEMISILFPAFSKWFQMEAILNIVSDTKGYTGKEDLNRLTAVPIVLNRFLPTLWDKIFGLGLGNCDYSLSFDFLISPFFQTYGKLNYMLFSVAFLLLETGIVGLLFYIFFFVFVYFGANKKQKVKQAPVFYCQLAKIMAIMCVLIMIYDASLRTEAAYMAYFVLALPFLPWGTTDEYHAPKLTIRKI